MACLFCIAMMYPFSKDLWEFIPLLKIVQLPWRFYIVLSFLLFMLSVYCAEKNQRATHIARYGRFLTIIILVFISTLTVEKAYNKSTKEIEIKHKTIIERSLQARDGVREYLPDATPEIYYEQVNSLKLDRVSEMFSGTTSPVISETSFNGDQIIAKIDNPKSQTIQFNQFYFPTWVANDLESGQQISLNRSTEGRLEFVIDDGIHLIKFSHKKTISEIMGIIISMVTTGILLFLIKSKKYSGKDQTQKNRTGYTL
jgi:hypothetical protein